MNTVEEIRNAIQLLTLEERAEITDELCGWTDDDWDKQMKADAEAGKFLSLNHEAKSALSAGETRPLNDILRDP